jgi:hypothetical protein
MQSVSCPSCGAPVDFRSHASVLAVCGFCQTTVLKDADAIKDLGKMSSVLEDFSPLQLGTAGVAGGRHFTVIGRIQLRYSAGMWNEWYLLFDDGETAWLGDSSGLYTLTSERKAEGALPAFDEIQPGKPYSIGTERVTASEVRTAECIGGQGELPFKISRGWQARVADFRAGATLLTLDSSDGEQPTVYTGLAVTLEGMKCQLLRDDEHIKASAGRYKGKLAALDCPSCGGSIKYLPGVTAHLVCPACHSQLDAASPKAQVVAAGEELEQARFTIPLGAKAKINGQEYCVIGAMVRADDEQTEWTEYLLYNTRAAFFWLIETEEGWSRASVMSTWPAWSWTGADTATLDKVCFQKLYEYRARVQFAAGAFNWRVTVGDTVRVVEFESGQIKLAAELSDAELTWSRSTPVAFDQIKTWFGSALRAAAVAPVANAKGISTVTKFIWWIIGLNALPLLLNFSGTFIYPLIGVLAIYLPAKFLASVGKGNE